VRIISPLCSLWAVCLCAVATACQCLYHRVGVAFWPLSVQCSRIKSYSRIISCSAWHVLCQVGPFAFNFSQAETSCQLSFRISSRTKLSCFPSPSGTGVSAGAEGFESPNQSALSGLLVSAVLNLAGFGPLRSTLGRPHKSHMPYWLRLLPRWALVLLLLFCRRF